MADVVRQAQEQSLAAGGSDVTQGLGLMRLPTEVRFGWGARAAVPELVAGFGDRVLVVTDPFLATTTHFRDMVDGLRLVCGHVEVHSDTPAELPITAVVRAAEHAIAFRPQVVVGYGGGSALAALLGQSSGTNS